MSKKTVSASERGITLVEIVIALAILGMTATLALGGVRLGVRTWETVGARVETESHTQIVRGFLRRTLSQATPVLETGSDGKPLPLFAGGSDSLVLVAPLADHIGLGGLQRLELSVEEMGRGDGRRLVLTRTPYHRADDDGAPFDAEPERHVLIEGAARIEIDYLRESDGGARSWTASWRDELNLPLALRLSIEPPEGGRAWPELIVPLRLTGVTRRR